MTTIEPSTIALVSYPADRKLAVIKAVKKTTGMDLKAIRDAMEDLPAVLMLSEGVTIEDASKALEAAGATVEQEFQVEAVEDDAEAPKPSKSPSDTAQSVWCALDDSCNEMQKAQSLLAVIKIALLNPEHQPDTEAVVGSLQVMRVLLEIIGDNMDIARNDVRSLARPSVEEAA